MHFFIEHTNLVAQTNAQKYGPNGTTPSELESKYLTSSLFSLTTETRAFACQTGMMIVQNYVQPDGTTHPDLVNIIIKPQSGLDIPFSSVKYYIYRGILRSSFLTAGGAIEPHDTSATSTNSEFIKKFWINWDNYKSDTSQPGLPNPGPGNFGYDTTLANNLNVEAIFNNTQTDVFPIRVEEGDWIGSFGTNSIMVNQASPAPPTSLNIGFEIIVDVDTLKIDLEYLRKSFNVIDVSSFLPASSPEELFIVRCKKEEVLNHIDPAAFFGLHFHEGIKTSTYSGGPPAVKTTVTKKEASIYSDLLSFFKTKNCTSSN